MLDDKPCLGEPNPTRKFMTIFFKGRSDLCVSFHFTLCISLESLYISISNKYICIFHVSISGCNPRPCGSP